MQKRLGAPGHLIGLDKILWRWKSRAKTLSLAVDRPDWRRLRVASIVREIGMITARGYRRNSGHIGVSSCN